MGVCFETHGWVRSNKWQCRFPRCAPWGRFGRRFPKRRIQPNSAWYFPAGWCHRIVNTGPIPLVLAVSYFRNDGGRVDDGYVSTELTVVVARYEQEHEESTT